ncbi:MAG: DsbA family protein [Pseudomonadota bacterium]
MRNTILSACILTASAAGSVAEELSFEDRVRAYILDNPEIILEALTILSEREAAAATQARVAAFPELFSDPPALGIGDPDAPIKVIEFFDYKCVPCKAVHPVLVDFVAQHPDVRIEMRHLPILTPGSERAARFAMAVRDVEGDAAYATVNDALWTLRGPLNNAGFERVAAELDLDFSQIAPVMESEAITARITYNRDAAIALEILGTPAFVTADSVLFGVTDIDVLSEAWLNQ